MTEKEPTLVEVVRAGGPALATLVDDRYHKRIDFCSVAMLTPSQVSRFCAGKRQPPESVVPRICKALGIPYDLAPTGLAAESSLVAALYRELHAEQEHRRMLGVRLVESLAECHTLRERLAKIARLVEVD